MSDCRKILERLTPYTDGLLPASERVDVEQHLSDCRPCRRAAHAERAARTVLRENAHELESPPLPPGLRSRCEALAREHARRAPATFWGRLQDAFGRSAPRLVPVSLSMLLVLFTVLAVFSLATQRSDTLLAAQLTADHSKCFRIFAAPDSPAADASELEHSLREQYGWEVRLPPSSPLDGVQLIGARRCLYADGRIPHVMYRVGGEDVSLFVLDGVSRREADITSLGHRSRIWSRGDRTYVFVAPERGGDMTRAIRYVMQEAH
jgi:anti-sigma factor RsiW